jgi:phenolic acid decarboxylase
MAHCVIYIKSSDEIRYFIRDCIQTGRDFRGSNASVTGVKEHLFDVKWTDDDVEVVKVEEKAVEGNVDSRTPKFSKKVSELKDSLRYQNKVVSNNADVNTVTKGFVRDLYSIEDEIKLIREKLSGVGNEDEWKAYQEAVVGLVNAGRKFKKEMPE